MLSAVDYAILLAQYFLLMAPFLNFWLKWVKRGEESEETCG